MKSASVHREVLFLVLGPLIIFKKGTTFCDLHVLKCKRRVIKIAEDHSICHLPVRKS